MGKATARIAHNEPEVLWVTQVEYEPNKTPPQWDRAKREITHHLDNFWKAYEYFDELIDDIESYPDKYKAPVEELNAFYEVISCFKNMMGFSGIITKGCRYDD